MSITYLGIDPGAKGALALVDAFGALIDIADMPVVLVGGRSKIAVPLLAAIVKRFQPSFSLIEKVGSMPKQGIASAWTFGFNAGVLEGVLAMAGVSVEYIVPSSWKRTMRLSADKGASRLMAMRRWPLQAERFERNKDDGRAEAALLADYARCHRKPELALAA